MIEAFLMKFKVYLQFNYKCDFLKFCYWQRKNFLKPFGYFSNIKHCYPINLSHENIISKTCAISINKNSHLESMKTNIKTNSHKIKSRSKYDKIQQYKGQNTHFIKEHSGKLTSITKHFKIITLSLVSSHDDDFLSSSSYFKYLVLKSSNCCIFLEESTTSDAWSWFAWSLTLSTWPWSGAILCWKAWKYIQV